MKASKSKYLVVWILLGIILAQMFMMIFAGINKKGFFVDEMWSYGLANSYYAPHIWAKDRDNFVSNIYVDNTFFNEYLEVDDNDAFKYDSVYHNLSNDAHPPLYFFVLHTLSSVFKNNSSKWLGIVPNILFFCIAAFFLYLVSKRMIGDKYIALVPVILWGGSTLTISNTILIRMYMLLCMFGLMNVWIHGYYLKDKEEWTVKRLVILFIINYLGFLTQYYYYFFAFFLSLMTFCILLARKEWKQLIKYSCTMFLAVGTAVASFTRILHLTGGGHGKNGVEKLISFSGYFDSFITFSRNLKQKMFYSAELLFPLVVFFALVISIYIWLKKTKGMTFDKKICEIDWYIISVIVSTGMFFILSSVISPYISDRYYFLISPYIWLVGVSIVTYACSEKKKLLVAANLGLIAISLYTLIWGINNGKVIYQYPRQLEAEEIISKYYDLPCIYIVGSGREFTPVTYCHQLKNFPKVLFIDTARKPISEYDIDDDSAAIIYTDTFQDQQPLIDEILANTRFTECKFLTRDTGVATEDIDEQYVYLFYRSR